MKKHISFKNFNDFFEILKSSGFTKEEFLFHSLPYISGFKSIINKTIHTLPENKYNILDFGCGTGLSSYLLSNSLGSVTAIDVYDKNQETQAAFIEKGQKSQKQLWKNLEILNSNLKFIFYDGKKIPFKNNKFDLVFAHAVLEHIPPQYLKNILKEINRVLKTNGFFIIARTPNKYALTEFLAKSHDVKFSKNEILNICKKQNFDVLYYQKTDFFPEIAPFNLQKFLNLIYPLTQKLDLFINKSPLSILSHHHFIILKKT